jgi:tetratricopeptide (TPR) repeat protein
VSQALEESSEQGAPTPSVRERVSEGLRGLLGRVERAGGTLAAGAAKGRGRAAEAAEGLRRSVPLRHGLAAGERGNLEAALALLREAVDLSPDDAEAVLALWNVALSCQQPEVAAPAMARHIHHEASSDRKDLAVEHWMELHSQVPAQHVDVATLVRLLPELRERMSAAGAAQERDEAEQWLRTALRACVDPEAPEMTTGLALRVFEQARFLDADVARRAGEIVLAASDLHETKRQHVEELLAGLDAQPAQARARSSAPRILEVIPVELADRTLVVQDVESGQRTRVGLRAVEAIAVAEVAGLADRSVAVLDLVLRRTAQARELRVLRMRSDAFEAGDVLSDASEADGALRGLPAALLQRSGAAPLPDPDSVLGTAPRQFESLEAYEESVLSRMTRR